MTNTEKLLFNFRAGLGLMLVFTVLLGGGYPLLVAVFANLFFGESSVAPIADKAQFHNAPSGSFITFNGNIIGSRLLGQNFTGDKYFWGRLSANNYDVKNSGGTNFSPANPKLLEAANARIAALQQADPENKAKIPVELITASGSGLDPHISLAAARYQIGRVSKARGMTAQELQKIVDENIDMQSKLFGEPYINVLELNLMLDAVKK